MTRIIIRIFHEVDDQKELVKTISSNTSSAKPLSGKTALQALRRTIRDLSDVAQLLKVQVGWSYSRALHPKANCSFHYKWEKFVVCEDASDAQPSAA